MPQAIERSLATPMIRPRLRAITWVTGGRLAALEGVWVGAAVVAGPPPEASGAAERGRSSGMFPSVIVAREHQAGVGAAETEAVRHHGFEAGVVDALTRDRIVAGAGIEILAVGRGRDEILFQHQQRVDRLVGAGGALAVAGQGLGRADRRQLVVAKGRADGVEL